MTSLAATFYLTERLCGTQTLDILQDLLVEHVPEWSDSVSIVLGRSRLATIPMATAGSVGETVCRIATQHGKHYDDLVREHGRGSFERTMGLAELRSPRKGMAVFIHVDDYLMVPGGPSSWGNKFSVRMLSTPVKAIRAPEWLAGIFRDACSRMPVAYANARSEAEWWASNMDESDGIQAIGVDLARHLPGLYWLNYLGMAYRPLFDPRRLDGVALRSVKDADGTLIQVADDPGAWSTEAYRELAAEAIAAIGPELFFDRESPDRPTVAPRFEELYGFGRVEARGSYAVLAGPRGPVTEPGLDGRTGETQDDASLPAFRGRLP